MAQATIPVDMFNPGQVFACLGFLEAADILCGNAEGGFDWSGEQDIFTLQADGEENPVAVVLEFLAGAEVQRFGPVDYDEPPSKKGKKAKNEDDGQENDQQNLTEDETAEPTLELMGSFPAVKGDRMALPIRLGGGNYPTVELGHWADGSSRNDFKLYAGNRSADGIMRAMLKGKRTKPTKASLDGRLITKGVEQLWEEQREGLVDTPFHVLTPMGGSFNFDPRGAWTAIDAGYSPNDQGHTVKASPVVEILAAWGLEHARPNEFKTRKVRYGAWGSPLPPILARAALAGDILPTIIPSRNFIFTLLMSGKNKVVQFAEEETSQ